MRHFGRIGVLVLRHGIRIAHEGQTDRSDVEGYGRRLFVWPEAGIRRSLDHLGPRDRNCHTMVGYALPRSGLSDCLSLPVNLETRQIPERARSSLIAPLEVVE